MVLSSLYCVQLGWCFLQGSHDGLHLLVDLLSLGAGGSLGLHVILLGQLAANKFFCELDGHLNLVLDKNIQLLELLNLKQQREIISNK